MPEGVHAYPRYSGSLEARSSIPVIAAEELRRATGNLWVQLAVLLALAFALLQLGQLGQLRGPTATHSLDRFLGFVNLVRWAPLVVAAVMAGPLLLDDKRHGALELYLSRAVTPREYLVGKAAAVLLLTTLAIVGPGLVYYGSTLFLFGRHPAGWEFAPAGLLLYGFLFAAIVSGLGLGLSCVARSSRAATLILLGSFAVLEIFTERLVDFLVPGGVGQIVSPFKAHAAQAEWIFGVPAPFAFPFDWGLYLLLALLVSGWLAVWLRQPRLGGDAPGGA